MTVREDSTGEAPFPVEMIITVSIIGGGVAVGIGIALSILRRRKVP